MKKSIVLICIITLVSFCCKKEKVLVPINEVKVEVLSASVVPAVTLPNGTVTVLQYMYRVSLSIERDNDVYIDKVIHMSPSSSGTHSFLFGFNELTNETVFLSTNPIIPGVTIAATDMHSTGGNIAKELPLSFKLQGRKEYIFTLSIYIQSSATMPTTTKKLRAHLKAFQFFENETLLGIGKIQNLVPEKNFKTEYAAISVP